MTSSIKWLLIAGMLVAVNSQCSYSYNPSNTTKSSSELFTAVANCSSPLFTLYIIGNITIHQRILIPSPSNQRWTSLSVENNGTSMLGSGSNLYYNGSQALSSLNLNGLQFINLNSTAVSIEALNITVNNCNFRDTSSSTGSFITANRATNVFFNNTIYSNVQSTPLFQSSNVLSTLTMVNTTADNSFGPLISSSVSLITFNSSTFTGCSNVISNATKFSSFEVDQCTFMDGGTIGQFRGGNEINMRRSVFSDLNGPDPIIQLVKNLTRLSLSGCVFTNIIAGNSSIITISSPVDQISVEKVYFDRCTTGGSIFLMTSSCLYIIVSQSQFMGLNVNSIVRLQSASAYGFTFENNRVSNCSLGSSAVFGTIQSVTTTTVYVLFFPSIINCTFYNNRGGLFDVSGSYLGGIDIEGCSFDMNQGAGLVTVRSPSAGLNLVDNVFTRNDVTNYLVQSVNILSGLTVLSQPLTDCYFSQNNVQSGPLFDLPQLDTVLSVYNCTFIDNNVTSALSINTVDGGAVNATLSYWDSGLSANLKGTGASFNFTSCVLDSGSSFYAEVPSGAIRFYNCTIRNFGGIIQAGNSVTVTACTLSGLFNMIIAGSLQTLSFYNQPTTVLPQLYVDTSGHLSGLYFSNCNLSMELSDFVSRYDLKSLEFLYLAGNHLGGNLDCLCGLTSIMGIDLSGNRIGGGIPDLSNLTQMYYFSVKGNALNGTIPASIGNVSGLQYLDLSDNFFSGRLPNQMGSLTSLQELFLSNNSFSNVVPDSLSDLHLLRFDAHLNHFTGMNNQLGLNCNLTLNPLVCPISGNLGNCDVSACTDDPYYLCRTDDDCLTISNFTAAVSFILSGDSTAQSSSFGKLVGLLRAGNFQMDSSTCTSLISLLGSLDTFSLNNMEALTTLCGERDTLMGLLLNRQPSDTLSRLIVQKNQTSMFMTFARHFSAFYLTLQNSTEGCQCGEGVCLCTGYGNDLLAISFSSFTNGSVVFNSRVNGTVLTFLTNWLSTEIQFNNTEPYGTLVVVVDNNCNISVTVPDTIVDRVNYAYNCLTWSDADSKWTQDGCTPTASQGKPLVCHCDTGGSLIAGRMRLPLIRGQTSIEFPILLTLGAVMAAVGLFILALGVVGFIAIVNRRKLEESMVDLKVD